MSNTALEQHPRCPVASPLPRVVPPWNSMALRAHPFHHKPFSQPGLRHIKAQSFNDSRPRQFADQNEPTQLFQRSATHISHSSRQLYSRMTAPIHEDMEEFQRLSDRYQPDLEGPLISQRLPIAEVVAEYAQADPTFVTKTRALAGLYDTYRHIKGDGQCGWRGTVFGYFELLALSGDLSWLEIEEIRVRSFQDTMTMAGVDYELLVDMFDNTWELFAAIKQALQNNAADDSVVLNVLNDQVVSESIIYHFKMMTSSYMALNADDFEPFLEMSLDEYRQTRIDPTNQEIDQIGLQALTTGVIAPAGIGLEVLYLDRSAGDAVTPHAFVPDAQNSPNIRLLYRPGHYDIIYKNNSPLTVSLQWNPEVVRSGGDFEQPSDNMYSYMFPDTAYTSDPFANSNSHATHHGHQYEDSQHHQSQYSAMNDDANYHAFTDHRAFSDATPLYPTQPYAAPVPQQDYFTIPRQVYTTSNSPPSVPTSPLPISISPNEPQIRLNVNMFKPDYGQHISLPLDASHTGSFANSQAHFSNKEFQPEMYNAKQG